MKAALALLSLALAASAAGDLGYRAQFVGGTLAGVPAKSKAQLNLTAPDGLIFVCRGQTLNIGYSKIDTLEYGQNVSRRYAAALLISPLFLLSKSRKHFVTIGYTDGDGKQQALVFQVEKNDIRTVLTTLEARSGRRVEYQDEEARKTGR
ncbi:MAG: hypothetical protein WBY44_01005 [Bryobacteraceae bacterium]|jgi:hypothetical protein